MTHPRTFSTRRIINYINSTQDETAASMLRQLLNDVHHLDRQVRKQRERMRSFHTALQCYSQNAVKNILENT